MNSASFSNTLIRRSYDSMTFCLCSGFTSDFFKTANLSSSSGALRVHQQLTPPCGRLTYRALGCSSAWTCATEGILLPDTDLQLNKKIQFNI
jgi:hypothetical protein